MANIYYIVGIAIIAVASGLFAWYSETNRPQPQTQRPTRRRSSVKTKSNSTNYEPGVICVICLEGIITTVVEPCKHQILCSDCAEAFPRHDNKCPLCRKPMNHIRPM